MKLNVKTLVLKYRNRFNNWSSRVSEDKNRPLKLYYKKRKRKQHAIIITIFSFN